MRAHVIATAWPRKSSGILNISPCHLYAAVIFTIFGLNRNVLRISICVYFLTTYKLCIFNYAANKSTQLFWKIWKIPTCIICLYLISIYTVKQIFNALYFDLKFNAYKGIQSYVILPPCIFIICVKRRLNIFNFNWNALTATFGHYMRLWSYVFTLTIVV